MGRKQVLGNKVQCQLKIRGGPNGIHFFNRKTGVNVLLDEVDVPVELWAIAPRQVSIALTNACDLNCSYCYAPKYKAKLDKERLFSWLEELDINGCLGVGFGGGEPTLYPDFLELCRWAVRKTDLAVTFTTHGHTLADRVAADLRGNVHFIRVSMDGINSTYEILRGKAFSLLRSRFETIQKIAPFGINFVVNALTFPQLDSATELASEVGAVEFLLLPEIPVHGYGGIDRDTSRKLQDWVNSYQGTVPLSVNELSSDGLPTCDPLFKETGLRAYAHIDASGVLKQSSYSELGIPIDADGIIQALKDLKLKIGENL